MISDDFARELRRACVRWDPAPGDQFRIEADQVKDDVYILSHMVIEPRTYSTGTVLHFNGTTEWALDTLAKEDALWLPREDQLRELLGGTFQSMQREDDVYRVRINDPDGSEQSFIAHAVEDAYAQAVLTLVQHATQ